MEADVDLVEYVLPSKPKVKNEISGENELISCDSFVDGCDFF